MFIFESLNFKHIHLYPMILSDNKITEIFYLVDEFCLSFEKTIQKHLIGNKPKRTPKMSCSEVITIMMRPLKNTHQISGNSQFFCFCIK